MKPGQRYAKGSAREREWVRRCYARGALWAGRMAGSHSAIDVAAVYPAFTALYQIKSGSAELGKEDLKLLKALSNKVPRDVFVCLVTWKDYKEPAVRVLYGRSDVLLTDQSP